MTDKQFEQIECLSKKLWGDINNGHEYSMVTYTEFLGIVTEVWERLQEEPVSEDLGKVGSLKSLEYYPEKKTTNKTSKGVFDANMPRRKAYLRGFKDGAHAHKELIANKPVSEELEEAIEKSFIYHDNRGDDFRSDKQIETAYRCGFETGAQWQKEKEYTCYEEAFEDGAKWQKEKKMMANAIGGVVTFDYDYGDKTYGCVAHDSFCLEDFGLKDRDEVKVIVIKED